MEILTLLKANIRYRKGTFISILILMTIIVMATTAIFSTKDNCDRAIEDALNRIDSGDLIVYISEDALTDELLTSIKEHDLVDRLKDIPCFYAESSEANGTKCNNGYFLRKLEEDYSIFNEQETKYTDSTESLKQGEIYVPLGVRAYYSCEIGDTIHITTTFGEYDFTVKGFIEEPITGSSSMGWKQFFISDEDFARMNEDCHSQSSEQFSGALYALYIYKPSDCTLSDSQWNQQLNLDTGITDYSLASLTKTQSIYYTGLFNQIFSNFLMVFSCLLFVIILIVIGHSLSTGIENDYVNLGILKAQGFTKNKLRQILLFQYLIAELAGTVLGYVLAIPLTAALVKVFQPITAMLAGHRISTGKSLLCTLILLLISTGMIFFLTKKVGTISPVRALSAGQPEQYFDSRIQMPISKKGLPVTLALRQLTSSIRRYLGTIVVAAILIFFMLTVTLSADIMDSRTSLEAMGMIFSDCSLTFREEVDDEILADIEAVIESITPIAKKHYFSTSYMSINGFKIFCYIYDNPEVISGVSKGRAPFYDNEVIITEIVADELGLNLGDTVILSHDGKQEDFIISGFYQSITDAGMVITISSEGGEKLGLSSPSSGDYRLADATKNQEVVNRLNKEFGAIAEVRSAETFQIINLMKAAADTIKTIIYSFSCLFVLIVVYMVCTRIFVKERIDIGIYKAIGFSSTGLRLQFAFRFLIMAGIGSALGVVLSLLFSEKLLNGILRTMGITNFIANYTTATFLVPIALICICFFVFAYLVSGRIRRVEVRELVTE